MKNNSPKPTSSKENHLKAISFQPSLDLYDWQKEAITSWYEKKFGIIEASTGSGKTWIALELLKSHSDCKFLIIVPKRSLVTQWKEMIHNHLHLKALSFSEKQYFSKNNILIEVINTVIRNIDEINEWQPNIIIYDEVHRYTGLHFNKALSLQVEHSVNDFKGKLGLTATMPNKEIERQAYETLINTVGQVVYTYSIADAKSDSLLAPYSLFVSRVGLTDEEQQEKEELQTYIYNLKYKITNKLNEKGIKFDPKYLLQPYIPKEYQFEEVGQLQYAYLKRRHLNYKARFKIYNGCLTIERILEKLPLEQILIFTMSIKVANEIAEELERKKISHKTVHSKNDPYDNFCSIKSFQLKDISVLVSVRTLDEGVDIPHVRFIVIIANSKQIRQMIQRVGRTLRIDPKNPNKEAYIILFEVEGDEFDISKINEGALNSYYFDVNEIDTFYNYLLRVIN